MALGANPVKIDSMSVEVSFGSVFIGSNLIKYFSYEDPLIGGGICRNGM